MSDVNKRLISDVNTHIWVFSRQHRVTYTTFGTHVIPMQGHLDVSHIAIIIIIITSYALK